MNRNKLLIPILILILSCIAHAEDYDIKAGASPGGEMTHYGKFSKSFMEEYETRNGTYVYKKTLQLRSNFSSFVKRFSRDGKVFYKYREYGKGNYDKYLNVTWDVDAEMEERLDLLYPLYTTRIVSDKDGNVIVKHEKHFDYDGRKIHYISSDGEGNVIKKKSFPIKGNTADEVTLAYFLKTFVAHRDDKTYRSFYLLSSEPRLYRIIIKVIGFEVLDLPTGKIKAIKLRLIPNLGLLTGLAGAFIPPTYVWYTEKPPYIWLQYEGLETGLGSSHIVVYASNFVESS